MLIKKLIGKGYCFGKEIVGMLIGIREIDKFARAFKGNLESQLVNNLSFMLIPFIKAIDFPAKLIKNGGISLTNQHYLCI